jgi:predicted O-methyltransferase YrrM
MIFYDKFLPHQKTISHLYNGDYLEKDIYNYITNYLNIPNLDSRFNLKQPEEFSQDGMGSNPITISFLEFLVKLSNPKTILEIGTFIGATTMALASNIDKNSQIITIEKYDKFANIAKENFKNNKVNNIKLVIGDAKEKLKLLNMKFDFVFLDGNKEDYLQYYLLLKDKINSDGIIVIDDIFFHGDLFNKNLKTEKGKGVKKLIEFIQKDDSVDKTILPISNGILILRIK